MTFNRKLIAVLAMLCLIGAQQAAFAHWAAHLGAPAAVGMEAPDGEHAAAEMLDQACTSCAAFAALGAALPGGTSVTSAATAIAAPALPPPQEKSVPAIRRRQARAPPAFL
jgi:hypothetical protein